MKLSGSFSRVTSVSGTYIPQIDGLRFLAIIGVIAYHVHLACLFHFRVPEESAAAAGDLISHAFHFGAHGVQFFFTISGFVLALPFAKHHLCGSPSVPLRGYYLRRVTRLEPPYLIHLAFLFLLCWLVLRHLPSHPHLYGDPNWAGYAGSRLFVSALYSNGFLFGTHPYPNVVLWSLEVEVQFYVVAPVLSLLFSIRRPLLRRGILAALILSSSLLTFVLSAGAPPYRVWASLAGNLHFFLVGFLLCDGYLTAPAGALRKRYWDILFLAAAAVFLALGKHPFVVLVVHPWLMFVCGSAALRGKACYALFGSAWIATIGGMCYTIYLYHMFLISCLIRLTTRLQTHVLWLDLLIQFALILPVILVVCAVLFKLFERPFMQRNWHLNLWRRLRSQLGSFRSSSAIH